jgi:carotenoid cleavage dioxygenase
MVKAHAIYNDFAAASRPFRAEVGIEDVEVEGTIPKELNGTFYRVCPISLYPRLQFLTFSD